MKDGGAAVVSVVKASGEQRILKAMSEAVNSPLIANMDKQKTKRLLYIVYSGKKNPAKMSELREINAFMEDFDENIEVLWGHYQDDELEDEIKVAIVATGFDQTDSSTGEEEMSDERRMLQSLREKYYAVASPVAPHETEKPSEDDEGQNPIPAADEAQPDEASALNAEEGEADGSDVPEGEMEDEEPADDEGSFWKIVKEKLKRWVEEV